MPKTLSLLAPEIVRCVAVYPLVPTRSFDDPLTYELPDALAATVVVGSMVEIPVGRAARVGLVAAVDVEAPEGVTLKPIARVIDTPPVPAPLIELGSWVADQYGCARTVAMSLIVSPRFAAQARASAVPHRRRQLAARRIVDMVDGIDMTKRQRDIAMRIPMGWSSVAHLASTLSTTRATLGKLAESGVVQLEERFLDELSVADDETVDATTAAAAAASASVEASIEPAADVVLTDAQLRAVAICSGDEDDSADPATVLMGITGAGKTEVYLELIARACAAGRGAIVLVPEIALTPQTSRRFVERFGAMVEVLHSGMTRAQRAAAWDRIASGSSRVVVGPRSAIFAPIADLGMVVVDEEHDSSYKQDSEPRYDARRVAWRRAIMQNARVVFGSATPRPETWHGVKRRAMLRERPGGGRLAPVRLVDLRLNEDDAPLTGEVLTALDDTLRRGRKAIVLHNRRGYATALHCRGCGHTFRCPNCDVSLVIHGRVAHRQRLACHHCGHHEPVPRTCKDCGAADIARMGSGTEQIESLLAERFGSEAVFRLDADATRTRGSVAEILDAFRAAGPSILAGTQMVAKGHDFPDVELAVVVDADAALAVPDFRAEERAFSLVAQLAGRAGRSAATHDHASVLVQTWDPEHEFLAYALEHDVEGFLEAELGRRRELDYPPFSRLVRVLVSAPDVARVDQWARAAGEGLRILNIGRVLGPAQLMRIAGRERAQVVLKTTRPAAAAAAVRAFLTRTDAARRKANIRMMLDVDPQSLL